MSISGKSSIKKKLTFIIMMTSSAALFLACASFATYEVISFRRSMPTDLAVLAQITGENGASALEFDDRAFAEETLLASLAAQPRIISACLYRSDGTLFAKYLREDVRDSHQVSPMQTSGHAFARDHLDVQQPVYSASGEQIGAVLLRSDLSALSSRITTYATICSVVLGASLLLILLLSARLQRVISDPILQLANTTARVARDKHYSVRVVKPSNDEIGVLYDSFNEMIEEIQQRDEALQEAHRDLEERVAARTSDLTEAHRLLTVEQTALRMSQHKLEALINSLDGVVWEVHPETFQFTFVSQQAEALLGVPGEEWTRQASFLEEHLHPDDVRRVTEFFRHVVARNHPHHLEHRMISADGRVIWIRNSATVVRKDGQPVLLRGVLQEITEQKSAEQELDQLHKQLLETSRQAGMAEVATGVLHNVGNVLNSVNVSATLACDRVRKSRAPSLQKVADLLQQNEAGLSGFMDSEKGRMIPSYLESLSRALAEEQEEILRELGSLSKNLEHIKDIVAMQQSYAKVSGVVETLNLRNLVEDALQFNAAAYLRHGIEVIREFDGDPKVSVEKHKVLQILINLFHNAKYAMEHNRGRPKRLVIGLKRASDGRVHVTVTDNGMGIEKENLTRIFSHGFTTRKDGHGFGLHSGALAAKEMGGSLAAYSGGAGFGATFTLELPVSKESNESLAA